MPRGRAYHQLDNRALLERLYLAEKKSTYTIAEIIGCSRDSVWRALKLYDIPIRQSGYTCARTPRRHKVRATVRDPDLAARLGLVAGKEVIA